MLSFAENIEANEKVILKYLTTSDDEYRLCNENNELINREKLLRLIQPNFFGNQSLEEMCRVMKLFYSEFGKIPNHDELWQMLKIKNTEIAKEEVDIIFGLNMSRYSQDFFYKYLKTFVLKGNLERTLMGVMSHVKTHDVSPDNIDEVFDFVRTEVGTSLNIDMTTDNMGLSIYDPKSHIQMTKKTRSTGFPFLDRVLGGGWEPKTLIVFQGRPKVGKSLVLANLAVRAALHGANVGIFTVELGDRKYVKRVGSNMFQVHYELYSKFVDEDNIGPINEAIKVFKGNHPNAGELVIKEYPTGGASSIDVENYFLHVQQQMNKKFDLVIVDYINLLKPTSMKGEETLYSKVKKISEELRRIAIRNEWCVVSATQIKTQYFNSEELHIDSTAESSGLVATVDSLFGITGEPGAHRIKIKNLANRDEGHMDSYKHYVKVKEYFRLMEDTSADSEYWSEDGGEELEKAIRQEYQQLAQPGNPQFSISGSPLMQTETIPVEPAALPEKQSTVMAPNYDFDKQGDLQKRIDDFSKANGFGETSTTNEQAKKQAEVFNAAPEIPAQPKNSAIIKEIDHDSILNGI